MLLSIHELNAAISTIHSPDEYVSIPSSCNDIKKDGLYYIKPTESGAVIPVICNNGYAMLDLSLDLNLNSYSQYLTSWDYSRNSFEYILPSLDDQSTFKQWWIPSSSDINTKFRIAPDCETCQTSSEFGDNVVYYTDSALFCFASTPMSGCTLGLNDYACNICDVGNIDISDNSSRTWTKCTSLQMKSDTPINYDHDECVTHGLVYRPVMTSTRESCTCYQPSTPSVTYQVPRSQLPAVTWGSDIRKVLKNIDPSIIFVHDSDNVDNGNDCIEGNKIYLTNEDFKYGTYRIKECGEYILNEDIVFNMNAPSNTDMADIDFSPNSLDKDELYWLPTRQQDANGEYPGLYSYAGSYSLGFFAGITVETDNVVINLNGYSMSMDQRFYLQQRYFTLIECGAKYFLPNQGPSNWQIAEEYYASNLEIKGPGTLGLSSHHAIHGMRNENLNIHDLTVTQFEVAGIQCNGCNNVNIDSCVVGPQNTDIPVLGRYAHARAMLPRIKQLSDEYGTEEIQFYNRDPITINDLTQRLITQMDMIYNNYINNIQYDDQDDEWIAAKKLFYNPTGWMDGGSSYGIVFNGDGAAVVGMGSRISDTSDIKMNNVEIYGIYNKVLEKIKVSINKVGATRLILFDTVDWIAVTDSIEDGATAQYIGDAYTDLIFAIKQHITSWSYLNSLYLTDAEQQYVFEGNTAENNAFRGIWEGASPAINDQSATGCNTDIQLHSSKGAIGLRFDGAQNVDINGIYIHDIVNWADLGANWCGLSDGPGVSNEDKDIQYGYTGTRAHGLVIDYVTGNIGNISIENVESWNGEAIGINVYKGCNVQMRDITVDNINAGTHLNEEQVNQLILPNLVPRACAFDVHNDTQVVFVNDGDFQSNVIQNNINGYDDCMDIGAFDDEGLDGDIDEIINDLNQSIAIFNGIKIGILAACVVILIAICFRVAKYCINDGVVKTKTNDDDNRIIDVNDIEDECLESTPLLH